MSDVRVHPVTRLQRCYRLRQTRALLAPLLNINTLNWRINGVGMLQAYLFEGDEDELRIHVYHNDLKLPNIHELGGIHDHRFNLWSSVYVGGLVHCEYYVEPRVDGNWRICEATHARAQQPGEVSEHSTEVAVECAPVYNHHIWMGQSYFFPQGYFHETLAEDYTVTLVRKLNQQNVRARFLTPKGIELPKTIMSMDHLDVYKRGKAILEEAQIQMNKLVRDKALYSALDDIDLAQIEIKKR
jgi:hypothetical protein